MTAMGTVVGVNELLAVAEPTAQAPDSLMMLGLLIGIPLLVIALVAAAVLGPQWSRAGRWRPGQPWRDDPVWLGAGDPQRVSEVISYDTSALVAGSAPAQSDGGAQSAASDHGADTGAPFIPGGARGRW